MMLSLELRGGFLSGIPYLWSSAHNTSSEEHVLQREAWGQQDMWQTIFYMLQALGRVHPLHVENQGFSTKRGDGRRAEYC